ncbi:hypothetical protein HELRODRAFT_120609, partial [Helobdella robusta]|uniref:G-protein coupled receptors family 2 profile 2 domain-containing protein n=1 Tax=Helobdella robusta TaxID=6412 RepID=T1EGQ2_HELRO
MLVEGLYLHTMIVWTLLLQQLKFWHYCLIGWGIPAAVVALWSAAKTIFTNQATTTESDLNCWLPEQIWRIDYITLVPIFVVLLVNSFFLASIVWVLITKLRSSNPGQSGLYKKATKATFVLFPLLGLTYLLLLWTGDKHDIFFSCLNAILHSTQGLFVSTVYCFLNSEVRKVLRKHFERWRDNHSTHLQHSQ